MRCLALSAFVISVFAAAPAPAWTETILYSFCSQSGCADGIQPVQNGLVFDSSGNLYGTTYDAGPNQSGEVFKLTPEGILSVPLAFPDQYGGGGPTGGLVNDAAGNLYGATQDHVFRLAPDGTESLLHFFDSYRLQSGVSLDKKGNVYGSSSDGDVIFRISPRGKFKILHAFSGSDGLGPEAAPVADKQGNLFGITLFGGLNNCSDGCGVVYERTQAGAFKVLYAFTGGDDGNAPAAGLALDRAGNLYGTTTSGGAGACGTVFKISLAGTKTTLHSFTYNQDSFDGCDPVSQPLLDRKGNLYGTTRYGGASGMGTVFKITATGKENILYAFGSGNDAAHPDGRLLAGPDGTLYGTTVGGGAHGWGTVYNLSPHS